MNHSPNAVWRKVEKRRWNQCWPWTGYTSSGRGRIDIAGVQGVYAHRAAYLATHPGSIPLRDDGSKEQHVLHRCDNPLCCNPRHLFVGSHSDNIADKVAKGRQKKWGGGIGSPRAKLSADQVRDMRRKKKEGFTKRMLAKIFNVSEATVSGACYGRHYQDVS